MAGANIEMSVVPAAHATWVPGDLWSDKRGTLTGGLLQAHAFLGQPLRILPPDQALIYSLPQQEAGRVGHLPQSPPAWSQALKQPEMLAVQSEHQTPSLYGTIVFPLTSQLPL